MKRFLAALALAVPIAAFAQIVQVTVVNATARVVGSFDLVYYTCTAVAGTVNVSAIAPKTSGSGSGRGGGYRSNVYSAVLSGLAIEDSSGSTVASAAPWTTGYASMSVPLPAGCYAVHVTGSATGTAAQGLIETHVDIPEIPTPPAATGG